VPRPQLSPLHNLLGLPFRSNGVFCELFFQGAKAPFLWVLLIKENDTEGTIGSISLLAYRAQNNRYFLNSFSSQKYLSVIRQEVEKILFIRINYILLTLDPSIIFMQNDLVHAIENIYETCYSARTIDEIN